MKEKILRIIYSHVLLVLLWLTFLLSPLLSVFRLYFVVNKDFQNFRIIGLSTLLYYFPFFISSIVLLIIVLWFKRFIDKKISVLQRKTLIFLSISSVTFLILARFLLALEERNYPNFLYGHFGLTVPQLELMSFVTALELFVFLFMLVYNRSFKLLRQKSQGASGLARREGYSFLLALTGLSGLIILSLSPFVSWTRLLGEVKGGFESRMGVHYKYIVLLKENSPEDVKVIHPPQGEKWPAIGNQPVLRYFLFPRELISGALLDNQELAEQIKVAYFVEIDPLSDSTHWPIFHEESRVIIFDEKTEIKYERLDAVLKTEDGSVYQVYF